MRLIYWHGKYLSRAILIDQSPIGRTPRSNPATIPAHLHLFANYLPKRKARLRGWKANRFSFNVKAGVARPAKGGCRGASRRWRYHASCASEGDPRYSGWPASGGRRGDGGARTHARRALELNRGLGDRAEEANSLRLLADAALRSRITAAADNGYQQALVLDKDTGHPHKITADLVGLGEE